ncbi:hypothetical protein OG689_12485 [Kitasatospora sp. NBC_00240]|uniref:hypothetical protein n=1 Tax=Kitasatospora sp. NBC_00240 TaxID=2903567 RepID=UPI00224F85A4|nr:hypothetical protein [Kitasatospora sp. NBC_00240]MCX5210100.1 hypothetical protein [Kitasatospora sp. NBC_00240]
MADNFEHRIPDRQVTAAERAEAVRVVTDVLADDCEAAFIVGSLSVGLGHAESDVDIVAVRGDATADRTRQHVVDGRRFDLLTVSTAEWTRRTELMSSYRISTGDRTQGNLDHKEMIKVVRYAVATRLGIGRTPELAGPDLDTVARVMIYHHSQQASSFAEDAYGALAVDDHYTALAAADEAVKAGIEAVLTAERSLYVGPKFLLRRAARSPLLAPMFESVWALRYGQVPLDGLAASAARLAPERLFLAAGLIAFAATTGWDGTTGGPALPDFFSPARPGAPLRDPFHGLMRFTDGFILAGPNIAYELTDAMALLWSRCNGADLAQLHAEFVRDIDPDVTVEVLEGALAALHGMGVISFHGN